MGAGASVPDPLPESEAAALRNGYTREQIDDYLKGQGQATTAVMLVRNVFIDRGVHVGRFAAKANLRLLDKNSDGKITRVEMKSGLKRVRIALSDEDLKSVYEFFDTNKDGNIDLDEFVAAVIGATFNSERQECIEKAWIRLNVTRDGKQEISVQELMDHFPVQEHPDVKDGTRTKEDIIEELIAEWDASGDSIVSQEEFVAFYKNLSCNVKDDAVYQALVAGMLGRLGAELDPSVSIDSFVKSAPMPVPRLPVTRMLNVKHMDGTVQKIEVTDKNGIPDDPAHYRNMLELKGVCNIAEVTAE